MSFQFAMKLEEIWNGEMKGITLGSQKILFIRYHEQVMAYEDRCAHLGVQLSEKGLIDNGVLTCSVHDWEYDVLTGQGVNPKRVCLKSFKVKIEAGVVYVDLETSL